MIDTLALGPSEELEKFIPDEVETIVGSYADEFDDEDEDSALDVLAEASAEEKVTGNKIRLRNIRMEDVRRLRRALGAMASAKDNRAIDHLLKLLIYAPSLTPSICKYLTSLESSSEAIAKFFDEALDMASLNDWQRVWIINTISELGLFDGQHGVARRSWIVSQRRDTRDPVVRSFCARALALAGALELPELVRDAEDAPAALLTNYASAISNVAVRQGQSANKVIAEAWGDRTTLHRLLLEVAAG